MWGPVSALGAFAGVDAWFVKQEIGPDAETDDSALVQMTTGVHFSIGFSQALLMCNKIVPNHWHLMINIITWRLKKKVIKLEWTK